MNNYEASFNMPTFEIKRKLKFLEFDFAVFTFIFGAVCDSNFDKTLLQLKPQLIQYGMC